MIRERGQTAAWHLAPADFNYALGMGTESLAYRHNRDFNPEELSRRPIATGPHGYGCTAGHGSSCGGALA